MDPWCAYLLFAQQQEAAQVPMRQRLQELVAPAASPAAPAAPSPAPARQRASSAHRAPPPPTSIPGSGRIIRM